MSHKLFSVLILLQFISCSLTAQNPGARDHLGFTYDSARNKLVFYGGNDVDEEGDYNWDPSTWEWDGKSWEKIGKRELAQTKASIWSYIP